MKRLPPAAMRASLAHSEATDHVGAEDRVESLTATLPSVGGREVGSPTMSGANKPPSPSARYGLRDSLRDSPIPQVRSRRPGGIYRLANGRATPSECDGTPMGSTTVQAFSLCYSRASKGKWQGKVRPR